MTIATDIKPFERNVLSVYRRATDSQIAEGLEWYSRAFDLATELDPNNPFRAAGIIAAVSPLTQWIQNRKLAIKTYAEGGLFNGTLSRNAIKATRIFNGEDPLDVLSGNKVRAFYEGIIGKPDALPCIDRHAFDIAIGRVTDNKTRGALSRAGVYSAFAKVYIRAAKREGITSTQMQAASWVTWRAEKGIVD